MEQNNQLTTIDQQQFGEMVKLPDVLKQNQLSRSNAVSAIQPLIDTLSAIDLTKVDAAQMEAHDVTLNDYQAKLSTTVDAMEGRRKPFTGFFDQVKSLFTAEEKTVKALQDAIKEIRNNWNKEKARRNAELEALRQKEQAKKEEAIQIKANYTTALTNKLFAEINSLVNNMVANFYSKGLDALDVYAKILADATPVYDTSQHNIIATGVALPLSQHNDVQALCQEVHAGLFGSFSSEWVEKLSAERDRLLELVPSRKMELERIANDAQAKKEAEDRIKKEAEDRAAALAKEQEERQGAVQANADIDKLNSSFDMAATAAPVVGLSKNTSVKKKCVITSHKQMAELLKWYVSSQLALMTVDEMNKKFSFIRTAYDKHVNDGGEVLQGVPLEDDYSTRTSRAKKEVAA